jgi:hypothetical protein
VRSVATRGRAVVSGRRRLLFHNVVVIVVVLDAVFVVFVVDAVVGEAV